MGLRRKAADDDDLEARIRERAYDAREISGHARGGVPPK